MEHRRKEPVKRPESDSEESKVIVIVDFGETDVCETVTFNDGMRALVAFKFILEIETSTNESVFRSIACTSSTGRDNTITETFKLRLNSGWRKMTRKTEPGLTDGTTTDAKVLLCGDTKGDVATTPVNNALLTRVSGSAKSIEDCKNPANQCSTLKIAESLTIGFLLE
jgi:hypothetical protein